MFPQEILLYLSHQLKCPAVFAAFAAVTSTSTARRFEKPEFCFNPGLERVLIAARVCRSCVVWAGHVIESVGHYRRLVNEALEEKRGVLALMGSKRTQAYRLRTGQGQPGILICTIVAREIDRTGMQIQFSGS